MNNLVENLFKPQMKKKEKSERSKSPNKKVVKVEPPPTTQEPDSNSMDFGGIPNRDLKKNMGCS
ncbi:hypothetical protein [Chryseolinea sp. H1M3-3]|uniref:hypothetical protein n=1 Tax=Chryseolinea sp. H1M3-3 TaxID=3034144 RepID=UPI0023EC8BBA|nr:hypothetical protein [Chryseolinea sp. H1M3-3]